MSVSLFQKIEVFSHRHFHAIFEAYKRLKQNKISTVMTIAIISMILALPLGFATLIENAQNLSDAWDRDVQISMYLQTHTSQDAAMELVKTLKARQEVGEAQYISPEEGLTQFENASGFSDILSHLPDNPLPPVIEITPVMGYQSPEHLDDFVASLKLMPHVDSVQLDLQWVERLHQFIHFLKDIVYLLMSVLVLTVFVISAHTIRLATRNQRQEIKVTNLVGGTIHFIRRPFLYTGFGYGFIGGVLAWFLVVLMTAILNVSLKELVKLYELNITLAALSPSSVVMLLCSSGMIGWLGAWVAVNQEVAQVTLTD